MASLAPRFSLDQQRTWRGALLVVFILGICCRFLIYQDLADKPAGRIYEWQKTEPWFYAELGSQLFEDQDAGYLLNSRNQLLTTEMLRAAREDDWDHWSHNRLPRGALAVYLLFISYGLTTSPALYKLLSLCAGALTGVLCCCAAANFFSDRRIGFLTGIVVGSLQGAVIASLLPGPWIWEAITFSALLLIATHIKNDITNPAEWLLFGLVSGVGIWLRPLFFWGIILIPLWLIAMRIKPRASCVAALAIPFVLFAGLLVARNVATHSTRLPIVGNQAWDYLSTVNPAAVQGPAVPPDIAVVDAADGSFFHALRLTAGLASYQSVLPRIVERKLREMLGARDVASTVSTDYLRRRSDILRLCSFSPDTVMAAGWAGLVLLLILRKLPRSLLAMLAILFVNGLFFGTTGFDRLLLIICFAMLGCAGFFTAWNERRRLSALPFAFITLWAIAHFALQIDDHARGSRFRKSDFRIAAMDLRRSGNEEKSRDEMRDWERLRELEGDLDSYWNSER